MKDFTTKFPTMKQLEQLLFRKLQEQFAMGMERILETLDAYLMNQKYWRQQG